MVKNVLRRKLVRDMWHNRMQFLAVILLCALGTWVFSGLDAAWRMLDLSAQTYFDEQNVADDLDGYSMEDENGDPLLEEDGYTDDDFSFDDGDDDLL